VSCDSLAQRKDAGATLPAGSCNRPNFRSRGAFSRSSASRTYGSSSFCRLHQYFNRDKPLAMLRGSAGAQFRGYQERAPCYLTAPHSSRAPPFIYIRESAFSSLFQKPALCSRFSNTASRTRAARPRPGPDADTPSDPDITL